MPLIECKLGHVETNVGGTNYSFDRDAEGRAVADVYDLTHVMCLLSVEHYREVKPLVPAAPIGSEDTPAEEPALVPAPPAETVSMGFGVIAPAAADPEPLPAPDAPEPNAPQADPAPEPDAEPDVPLPDETVPEPDVAAEPPLPAPAIVLPVPSQQKKLARRRGRGK